MHSAGKLLFVFFLSALMLQILRVEGTNSFFVDRATVGTNTVSAGYWIPEVSMTVTPDKSGWYTAPPCIKLFTSIEESTLFYYFVADSVPATPVVVAPDTCFAPPEGKSSLVAYAVHNDNSNWISEQKTIIFWVDTQAPAVAITDPDNGDDITIGTAVPIKATIVDNFIVSYNLTIAKKGGVDLENIDQTLSASLSVPTKLFDWDTDGLEPGTYVITLAGTDESGNKSTVSIEINLEDEQVDWHDVVINELMWRGTSNNNNSGQDEWIELRNMTNKEINLSGWRLMQAGEGSGGHVQIPNGYSVKPNGYFLIIKKKWDDTSINLSEDLERDEGMTNVSSISLRDNGEKFTLQDQERRDIDIAWQDGVYPPSGIASGNIRRSMERLSDPGNGQLAANWIVCTFSQCNDITYWHTESFDYGTPGKANIYTEPLLKTTTLSAPTRNVVSVDDGVPVVSDPHLADVVPPVSVDPEPPVETVKTPPADPEEPEVKKPDVLPSLPPADPVKDEDNGDEDKEKAGSDEKDKKEKEEKDEPEEDEDEKIITWKVDISVKGKLKVDDDLDYDVDQKIKSITVKGAKKLSDFDKLEIDLCDHEKVKKEKEIEIEIKELKLPKGIEVVSHQPDDDVVEIEIEEEDEDKDDKKKDDDKPTSDESSTGKKETIQLPIAQPQPKGDLPKDDDDSDGNGDGDGDGDKDGSQPDAGSDSKLTDDNHEPEGADSDE